MSLRRRSPSSLVLVVIVSAALGLCAAGCRSQECPLDPVVDAIAPSERSVRPGGALAAGPAPDCPVRDAALFVGKASIDLRSSKPCSRIAFDVPGVRVAPY